MRTVLIAIVCGFLSLVVALVAELDRARKELKTEQANGTVSSIDIVPSEAMFYAGGKDTSGVIRAIRVDEQGRVICAPQKEDVLWLTRQPGSLHRTPVFSRDSQFIGTERAR